MTRPRVVRIGAYEYRISQGRLWVRWVEAEKPEWIVSAHNAATIGVMLEEMVEGAYRPIVELMLNPTEEVREVRVQPELAAPYGPWGDPAGDGQ